MDEALVRTAAGVASAGAGEPPALPSHTGSVCLNCGARLHGRFCHDCGQSSDDHHRSIGHLLWEALEGFTHLDGRLLQTIPALLFRPGRLARDHIEGRRQRHVPPFRLFLISLLIFMLAAEFAVSHRDGGGQTRQVVTTTTANGRRTYQVGASRVRATTDVSSMQTSLRQEGDASKNAMLRWALDHVSRAVGERDYFTMLVFQWAHRLAVLLLPILAGFLTLAYVYPRRFYVYDHLVVSMQYLSFCFLIWAAVWATPKAVSEPLAVVALGWTPFNLYLILRHAYGSRRVAAALKAGTLWLATVAAFGLLLAALLALALNAV